MTTKNSQREKAKSAKSHALAEKAVSKSKQMKSGITSTSDWIFFLSGEKQMLTNASADVSSRSIALVAFSIAYLTLLVSIIGIFNIRQPFLSVLLIFFISVCVISIYYIITSWIYKSSKVNRKISDLESLQNQIMSGKLVSLIEIRKSWQEVIALDNNHEKTSYCFVRLLLASLNNVQQPIGML